MGDKFSLEAWLRLMLASFTIALSGCGKHPPARSEEKPALPPGWIVYSRQWPGDEAISCASSSEFEWKVSTNGETIKITDALRGNKKPEPDPLPFKIEPIQPMTTRQDGSK